MSPDNYTPRIPVLRTDYENYLSYLRHMGADDRKILEMTKDIVVIDFVVETR